MVIIVMSIAQDLTELFQGCAYTGNLAHYPPSNTVLMGCSDISFTAQNVKMDWGKIDETIVMGKLKWLKSDKICAQQRNIYQKNLLQRSQILKYLP